MPVTQQFDYQWQKNGAKIYHIANATELPEVLQQIIPYDDRNNARANTIVVTGLPDAWGQVLRRLWEPDQLVVWKSDEDAEAFCRNCAQASVGITGCAWAAADTGSVTLYGTRANSLLPSLLPPVHVVILSASQIFPTFAEGLAYVQSSLQEGPHSVSPPFIKIIAGPSMTGDIEGQLITGVHGPKDLYAIVIEKSLV
ncbi:LutC/YkgG family protein [Sulfobacillus thermosulfidooxidans]|uniref:LutC/YkgG family protein n=1 Tax=Sulfobacillus thermosulfidooxidans TaxID=28034 RepID=UPI0006B5A208|nr:lactate utilization protein [Sulfobacillus thermosulfidooxidans]